MTADPQSAGPIRAVIAEDHYLVREGTRKLLESSGRVEVIASVSDKIALLEATERLAPDAVVVDIRMPPTHQMEGIEAAHEIRARFPGTGVVVLSQYANALYAFQLFRDGTGGLAYLVKDRVGDLDQLLGAVVAVTEGRSVIDSQVVESLLPRNTLSQHPELTELTDREHEVLREMAQGKSNQAIADVLYVSESAVEKHVSAIFAQLGLEASDAAVNRRVAAVLTYLETYAP
jgi:DNA-binding NarL/FixJ family response regulator